MDFIIRTFHLFVRLYEIYFPIYEVYFQIGFSALVGFVIGYDRTHKHKPAGVKTYTYVTVASTLITVISIQSVGFYSSLYPNTMMDPMRLTAQIVTGLGFIGAGVILKDGLQVKGLTSAAMIFFAGGIGIGIGATFYGIVIAALIITFMVVRLGNWVESKEKLQHTLKSSNLEQQDTINL